MRGFFRGALLAAAAVAGAVGMASVQQKITQRIAQSSVRASDRVTTTTPAAPTSRVISNMSAVMLHQGRRQYRSFDAVWVGAMRPGGGPVWKVGRRGRSRLGGRS